MSNLIEVNKAHEQLLAALEFYADADTWEGCGVNAHVPLSYDRSAETRPRAGLPVRLSPGRRAREALQAWRLAMAEKPDAHGSAR